MNQTLSEEYKTWEVTPHEAFLADLKSQSIRFAEEELSDGSRIRNCGFASHSKGWGWIVLKNNQICLPYKQSYYIFDDITAFFKFCKKKKITVEWFG